MHIATKSAFEHVLGLHLHPLWTLADLVTDLGAIVADVVLRLVLAHLLVQLLGPVKVLLHEYLGMVVRTLGALFAVAVHVIPTELADYMFAFAQLAVEAKTHVEVRATLIDMAVGTVLPFLTTLLHKIGAYFQIMTEVAFVAVPATPHRLEFVARLDLALVMRIGTVVGQLALSVDELFAHSVGR